MGCGGVMVSLVRTRAGEFEIENACKLAELQTLSDQGRLAEAICPVERMFDALPALIVKEEGDKALRNGNQLKPSEITLQGNLIEEELAEGGRFRAYSFRNQFYGIYEYRKERNLFFPVKLFFECETG